jgi:hypothetical protein
VTRFQVFLLASALASLSLSGCCSLCPSKPNASTGSSAPLGSPERPVRVAVRIPSQPHRFTTLQKLNPIWWFGNADDPEPPADYRPGKALRTFYWYCRNPYHNFDHYVIGISDKPFTRSGPYPNSMQNPHGGWNWAVCRYKWWQLPFVDYQRGRFEFYFGWRTGGNFGIKVNFSQRRKPAKLSPRAFPADQSVP